MSADRPHSRWWIPLGALLLTALYLPSLATPFDMVDDGNLVYAEAPMPLGERVDVAWQKVLANMRTLGPFRPTLWAHWEVTAEVAQGSPFVWRLLRLCWIFFAASMLLWLLRELGIHPMAALLAGMIVMWNRYRNEIWTSLTLSEGVAMPYAMLTLIAAVKASRSRRPWRWDLIGSLSLLIALGRKNTFVALVPAQLWLRLRIGSESLREGLSQKWKRCLLLSLPLLLPLGHYVYFKMNWHQGQYLFDGPSIAQLGRILRSMQGAISLPFLAVGLILAIYAMRGNSPGFRAHRVTLIAGLLLFVSGVMIYLPVGVMSGRYTMPGVWGLDLMLAVFFTVLLAIPWSKWKRASYTGLICGLLVVVVSNVGRQQKFAARANLLWKTLHRLEHDLPTEACIGWVSQAEGSINPKKPRVPGRYLGQEEGIHFLWHLEHRGRLDLAVALLDPYGKVMDRTRKEGKKRQPVIFVTEEPHLPKALRGSKKWQSEEVHVTYWAGFRSYRCFIWRPQSESARNSKSKTKQSR